MIANTSLLMHSVSYITALKLLITKPYSLLLLWFTLF